MLIGEGGNYMGPGAGPGPTVIGGGGLCGTQGFGGQGGGYSGLFISSVAQANSVLIAGAGGGGAYEAGTNGGAGGGSSGAAGANGVDAGGGGGTQIAGGTAPTNAIPGSALQGGNPLISGDGGGGGGGGGGYWGGGGGSGTNPGSAGGGGSGYINTTYITSGATTQGAGSAGGGAGSKGTNGNATLVYI